MGWFVSSWEAHIGCSVLDHGVVFDIQHSERITAQEDKPKPWQRVRLWLTVQVQWVVMSSA